MDAYSFVVAVFMLPGNGLSKTHVRPLYYYSLPYTGTTVYWLESNWPFFNFSKISRATNYQTTCPIRIMIAFLELGGAIGR